MQALTQGHGLRTILAIVGGGIHISLTWLGCCGHIELYKNINQNYQYQYPIGTFICQENMYKLTSELVRQK